MKFEVSTEYLPPIEISPYESVDVVLPDGRMVAVFADRIYVRTQQDIQRHRDGKAIWRGMSSRSRQWPYGKVRQPAVSGAGDGSDEDEPPQNLRPASQFFPVYECQPPPPCCAASAAAKYDSGVWEQAGQDRSLGVYFAPHFPHSRRYADDQGSRAGRPPACLGAIFVTLAPQLGHASSFYSLTRDPQRVQSRNP